MHLIVAFRQSILWGDSPFFLIKLFNQTEISRSERLNTKRNYPFVRLNYSQNTSTKSQSFSHFSYSQTSSDLYHLKDGFEICWQNEHGGKEQVRKTLDLDPGNINAENTSLKDTFAVGAHQDSISLDPSSKNIKPTTPAYRIFKPQIYLMILKESTFMLLCTICMMFGSTVMRNYEVFERKETEGKAGNTTVIL